MKAVWDYAVDLKKRGEQAEIDFDWTPHGESERILWMSKD